MGVGELTNDPGARNNTRERVNVAGHDIDVHDRATRAANNNNKCKHLRIHRQIELITVTALM